VAAAQEERFTRKKHDPSFPVLAVKWCLEGAGVVAEEVDYVAFYDKPFLKFERLLETYLAFAPRGFSSFRKAIPVWIGEKLFQKDMLLRELKAIDESLGTASKLLFAEHHFSHAASAFYPSPFEEAAVLTMDGVGEWATTSAVLAAAANCLSRRKSTSRIRSGYSTLLLPITPDSRLIPVSTNSWDWLLWCTEYAQTILDHLIDVKADGSFRLNLDYFDYCTGLTMTNARFDALFGGPAQA